MSRRSFAKMLAGLGFSSQILSTASAKSEEDSLSVATHEDEDKSDRKGRYRTDAETDYNPTPYYVVQLVEKESPVKEVSKSIEEKDSRIESLIGDSKDYGR